MAKRPTHVQQAINELEIAEAYGNKDRAKAARKVLAAAGYDRAAERRAQAKPEGVQERQAAPPQQQNTNQQAGGAQQGPRNTQQAGGGKGKGN